MKLVRSAGILLHPTSFPGPDGIGDLGPEAYAWVDFLKSAGCSIWQTLPLGPTGYGDSPYQCFSAFAGNPYLISPQLLLDEGLLQISDFDDRPKFEPRVVNYGIAISWKSELLHRAFKRFDSDNADFKAFCDENSDWLEDYAMYRAIKDKNGGQLWLNWEKGLKSRDPQALAAFKAANEDAVLFRKFAQYSFFKQWTNLKNYTNKQGITIIGDIPIFVSLDSSDVWAHPEQFMLDGEGNPTVVAGVPPDYFCPTGQLWGNPLYRWPLHKEQNFSWWMKRIHATLKLCDLIRLDHFRGFAGYWEVPAGDATAQYGRWVEGPGEALFEQMLKEFGSLPIIAEDLGEISQDVIDLREKYGLPGMKVLQFAFGEGANNAFLPSNYEANFAAYTGTHDNQTTMGWFKDTDDRTREFACRYLNTNGEHFAWDAIRAIWQSVAVYAIAPLQDFLEQGDESRMNHPGGVFGNWGYRYTHADLTPDLAFNILNINNTYNRIPEISGRPLTHADIQYNKA